jgi:signal transduction histidine kinase
VRAWLPRGNALPEPVWGSRHRGILAFAWLHVPVLALVAVLHHDAPVGAALGILGVGALAALGSFPALSRPVVSSATTSSLLLSTALLIHSFHGLIELHFHFFVVIAVVAMYQQWTPYLLALAYVVVHHAVMGVLMPMAVYNHPAAMEHPVLFAAIHGAFVLMESVACLMYWKATEQALDSEREQRQRAEEVSRALSEANREMADLMAMVSHDLRAPLTVINGTAELALESWGELDDSTRHAFMTTVGTAGHSLEEMLEETLTLSALDADGLSTRPVAVRLEEYLRGLHHTTFAGLDLRLDSPAGATVLVDRQHLGQMVTNLLTNAVKYGAAPYAVTATVHDDEVELVVRDSGPGVEPAFVPRLFDRYTRSDDARRSDRRGTGLGLYIVRSLALANGGEISYRRNVPTGSEFVLRLRRAPHLQAAS